MESRIKVVKSRWKILLSLILMVFFYQSKSQTYCASAATSNADEDILNVTIGTLNSTSSCSTTGGAGSSQSLYSDYTTVLSAPFLTQGVGYAFSVQIGTCGGNYSNWTSIYIDFNKNGSFTDAGEMVYTNPTYTTGPHFETGTITIPTTAPTGVTRMRVVNVETTAQVSSCGTYTWGETEDYNVNIGTPPAYDIAMNSIQSPTSWGVGNNTLVVKAGDYGTTTLTTADFGYSLNNGTPVTQNITFGTALTLGQTYTHTFSTAVNIPAAGTYTLKTWVRNPNGIGADGNTSNDTITRTVCTGISGSFTINPSGTGSTNYTSFTAAANALNGCGISGPCYFTVSPGTYTEKITLTNVLGTSATNIITFDGVDSLTRIITFNSTTTVEGVINLIGTSYVTIKNLRIVNTGTTYGSGINIQSGSNYNTISNCRINVAINTTTTNIYGVGICGSSYSTTSTGSYNTIKNCKIVGGYMCVVLWGTSTAVFTPGNKVLSCDLSGAAYYGIYGYYQNLCVYSDNRVFLTYATNTYGITSFYSNDIIVDRNIIVSAYMGLYIYYTNYYGSQTSTTHGSVSNNIVNLNGPYVYSTNYGLYSYYNYTTDFKHNTIYTAATSTGGYGLYLYGGGNVIYKNNIFQANNAAHYAVYNGLLPVAPFQFDYNIMYAPATTYVYWLAAYANLAALKAATPGYNQNGLFKIPNYVNSISKSEDLHLSSSTPADQAELASALLVDVDNEARCLLAPSIGADDSKFGAGTLLANFSTPDTVFINSPTTFSNYLSSNTPSYKEWYINGAATPTATTHDLTYTFTSPGTYTIKLKMIGCFERDSITKTIVVYNLTQKPIANFIADINTVPTNQNVTFKDLTTKGPSYWQWSVTPTVGVSFVNGTTSNSQNPVIKFANAGLFSICLWDSNALGRSNTACKNSYIFVQATAVMCTAPFDTKVGSGNIYDDGGQNGNYNTNKTCSFLIDPCASSVSLTFTGFSLASGSFFRAYNGIDNTAPALHTGTGFTGVGLPPVLTASSGKMFIEFVTGGTADKGFEATWTSIAGTFAPPSGKINGPDTADDCGSNNTFSFVSNDAFFNKDAADYTWYFTNSSFPTYSSKGIYSVQYGFTTAGIYPIRLDVNGCGGVSTFYDTVRVITPGTAPLIDFTASSVRATTTDVITLTDISKYGTTSRQWTITGPGVVADMTGTSTSSIYGIKLVTPGVYTVKLSGTNCKGTDQLIRTNYITIFQYCNPIVTNLNADFAIENVTFGRIDTVINGEIEGFDFTNVSPAVGTVSYRDNTNKLKVYSFGTKAVEAVADLGGTYNFSVRRAGNLNSASINIWIDYNQDGTFQSSELVASSGTLTGKTFTGSITIPTTASLGITRMRIGTSVALQSNLPCGANLYGDFNDFRVKITPDLSAPVIIFNGSDVIFVEVGRIFTDPGYTVVDNITNPCPNTVSGITSGTQITSHPFTSSYTVTATDAAGNISTRTRTVKSSPDVTKPVITLNGLNPISVPVGTAYTDAGATALDFFFGSLTASIVSTSTVNTAVTGTYTVTYNVTDAAGNVADAVVRTVNVTDSQKPVITVSGPNPLYVEVLTSFTPPVATVTDNYCTGVTYSVTGVVNTSLIGTYTLTYNATDCSGNDAVPVVLTVIVRDTKAPTLLFILGDTMVIDVKTATVVPEPGYVLNDNYYNIGALTLNVNYSNVKLDIVGMYPVRYYISDPSGNVDSSHVRVYNIVDRMAPKINLIGDGIIDWKRWTPYVDPGATITDNYYTSLTPVIDASKVNIYLDGVYPVTFNVTDPSNNKAIQEVRYVKIYTAASGINNKDQAGLIRIYPNPNNGVFNFDANMTDMSFIKIVIFDANGKQVYSSNSMNPIDNYKMQIDLSKEAAGMYFINVITDKSSMTKSFAIQK